MEIPIYIGAERAGTLTVSRSGCRTVLDARLRDPGRVVRLWVYGAAEAWYLGVPAPEGAELCLTRRLSPAVMADFPAAPLYAGEVRRETPPAEDAAAAGGPGRRVLWFGGRPHYF